ncbi:MAG: hypothetical protein ACOC32_00810 [Nanoarchaeota archaeon]
MKITVDTQNDGEEEIRKVIAFLQKMIGDAPEETAPDTVQDDSAQSSPQPGIDSAMPEQDAQSQPAQGPSPAMQPQDQSAPTQQLGQPVQPQQNPSQQPQQNPQRGNTPQQEDENYGQQAAAMLGIFDSDVPSNIPLNQLNQQKNQQQDDDDDTENGLGLDIVPY